MTKSTLQSALTDAAGFRARAGTVLDADASQHIQHREKISDRLASQAAEIHPTASPPEITLAGQRGDWDLNPELRHEMRENTRVNTGGDAGMHDTGVRDTSVRDTSVRPAAVLVPVIARDELSLLLTVRSQHMKSHAGQISFPGGKIEPDDTGPLDAALRETREEIGLDASLIEPLGFLDSYRTGTDYLIMPVVALVQPEFSLTLDPGEVAESFEVPLQFLMDETNHQRHSIEWRGHRRFFHAISHGHRYIWGATAGIIKNLHERLSQR